MRKNKKLLLASVAAMGALALGVGATSTFAWFQVTAQGSVSLSGDMKNDVVAVAPTGNVAVNLPVKVALESSPANLELAHYYAAYNNGSEDSIGSSGAWSKGTPASYSVQNSNSPAGLFTAFHLNNQGKTLVYNDAAIGGGNKLWDDITITITAPDSNRTVDGVAYTPTDIATLLNGKYVDVTVEAATFVASTDSSKDGGKTYYKPNGEGAFVAGTPSSNPQDEGFYEKASTRAKLYGLGTSAVDAAPAAPGETSVSETTTGYQLSDLGGGGKVLHFGIYIEGVRGDSNVDDAVTAGYIVTVSQHS